MPVGFIDELTPAGATFRLTPQGLNAKLGADDHVTVWHYYPEQTALARYTGSITRVDKDTATFAIRRAEVDERWPAHVNPLGAGAPVYLALRGSFEPDTSRALATAAPGTTETPGHGVRGIEWQKDGHRVTLYGATTVVKMVDFGYMTAIRHSENADQAAPPPQLFKAAPPWNPTREHRSGPRSSCHASIITRASLNRIGSASPPSQPVLRCKRRSQLPRRPRPSTSTRASLASSQVR